MCRTTKVRQYTKPQHANAIPYNRKKKHKKDYQEENA